MTILEIVANYSAIVFGAIATFFTIYFAVIEIRKIVTAPHFIVGILPDPGESTPLEKLGRPVAAPEDKWHFNKDYLATEYAGAKPAWLQHIVSISKTRHINELDQSKINSRRIAVGPDGYVSLFILIQNQGGRVAEKFTLIIRFDNPSIQITNLDLGTQLLTLVFTIHPNEFKNPKYLDKLTPQVLVTKWEQLDTASAVLSLIGDLESDSAEIIRIEIKAPKSVERFVTYFDVDCPGEYWRERRFAQDVTLIHSNKR